MTALRLSDFGEVSATTIHLSPRRLAGEERTREGARGGGSEGGREAPAKAPREWTQGGLTASVVQRQRWTENTEKRGKNTYSADQRNFPETIGGS